MKQILDHFTPHLHIGSRSNVASLSLLTEKEVATLLNVTPSCLQAWRYRGDGLPFIKISGRCIRYRWNDLQEWIDDHRCSSTSQYKEGEIS